MLPTPKVNLLMLRQVNIFYNFVRIVEPLLALEYCDFCMNWLTSLKQDSSQDFSEREDVLLFTTENIAVQLNRISRLSDSLLCKIPPAQKITLSGSNLFYTLANLYALLWRIRHTEVEYYA